MSKLTYRILSILLIPVIANSIAHGVGSGGISNEVPSAESLASLIGVAGSKTDPAVAYMNPASLGDIENNASLGITYFHMNAKRNGTNGSSDKMESTSAFVPNFSAGGRLGDGKLGIGLSVISPYGLETEWGDNSNVRYVATKSTLKMLTVSPAVSYRLNSVFALGIGIDYFSTFDTNLEKKAPVDVINFALGFPTAGSPDANTKLEGDGAQWGYHSGLLFNPVNQHTFGLAYHSEVKTKIEGNLEVTGLSGASGAFFGPNFTTPARTDIFYPQNVQFGYKYSPSDKWAIGLNLAWYDWSSNKQLEIVLPNASAAQRTVFGAPIPLHWRDVWSGTIGGFYRYSETWKINYGAYYLPAVYPEATFSPAVPDLDKIGISVGPAYNKGAFTLDTVYNPLFYKKTTINNNIGQASTGLASADISGEYKAIIHIFGINARYKF